MYTRIILLTSILILFLIPVQAQPAEGKIELELNGKAVTAEMLSGELFCILAADTFTVRFVPTEKLDASKLTFSRIDLLGQISLGKPQLLGSQIKVPGSEDPLTFTFTVRDLISQPMALKNAGTTIRTSLEIGPLLLVEGNRIQKSVPVHPASQRLQLVLVPAC